MGRKYFGLSPSACERMLSRMRAKNAKIERENLIREQYGKTTSLPDKYSVDNVDFDLDTRIAKIRFLITKQYRTIDRYVTQNYQRYPIYSGWKTRTSTLDKRVKLTNITLETLNLYEDEIIRQFADEIILSINKPELIPSWLANKIIENDYITDIENEEQKGVEKERETRLSILRLKKTISISQEQINFNKKIKDKINTKLQKKIKAIKKLESRRITFIKRFITFGLYPFILQSKKTRAINKKIFLEQKCQTFENIILKYENEIKLKENNIIEISDELKKYLDDIEVYKVNRQHLRDDQLSKVTKLDTNIENLNGFFPLRNLSAYPTEKITGCYIIQNIEKQKYYVGQSKDVIKRIRQHFKGTTPKNIIFAEDYFTSNLLDKNDLFYIKIIPLKSKNELDDTERKLIAEFNSNLEGYNSTKGNT